MRRLVIAAAAVLVLLMLPAIAVAPLRASDSTDGRRAIADYRAMQRAFFDDRRGGYREALGDPGRAHAWPVSQALAAALAVGDLKGGEAALGARSTVRRLDQLEEFRAGRVYGASHGGAVYWDDNEWIAQDMLATGNAVQRQRALAIFNAVVRAWDSDGTKPCAGGVQWTEARGNDDRNTVSTVNGALVGLQLYARLRRPELLSWSRKMLNWVDRCMLGPDGLYRDHISGDGTVDTTIWSYNQGSLIGALVLLAHETGDRAALDRAEQLTDRALAYFDGRWLTTEPPEFAAIFFRNVLTAAPSAGRPDWSAAAQRYVDAWARRRNAATGLYSKRLLGQAAIVQIEAALAKAGR